MQKLITGLHQFQKQFLSHKELFDRLSHGQNPDALFITCSDSRINPNLITMTNPGDLFILRNAGNIVPAHSLQSGGEGATIEFALVALGVKDIIICGHSLCGAIKGILEPDTLDGMPSVQAWLMHAAATKRIVDENYTDLSAEQRSNAAVQENVLVQIENLRTHPAVAARLARGELKLHGWIYKLETGDVFSYDADEGQFLPITEVQVGIERRKPRIALASDVQI